MRITRLYHRETLACGQTIQLDKNTSTHLVRVLRTKTGTAVTLFNGDGYDYLCKTLDSDLRKTRLSIESKSKVNNESNLFITLIQGLSRLDRMEASIQKSVELGVNRIIPVLCQYSNSKLTKDKQLKKLAHWHNVAISACEQSGRSVIPEISDINSLDKIDGILNPKALKIILDPETKQSLKTIDAKPEQENCSTIEIFIGPEGGLAEQEISRLQALGFQDISFGPRILRTETAGPAVISALQILWGDF